MRNSILHPTSKQAQFIGVVGAAVTALFIGIVIAKVNKTIPKVKLGVVVKTTTIEDVSHDSGNVYLMDSDHGRVPIVGTFSLAKTGGIVSLKASPDTFPTDQKYTAVYWEGNVSSYVPHMQFLFHGDLRQQLTTSLVKIWHDPQVRQKMGDVLKSQAFWKLVFSNSTKASAPPQTASDDFWDKVSSDPELKDFFAGTEPSLSQNSSKNDAKTSSPPQIPEVETLLENIEPYFKEIFSAIVWEQPPEIPNAYLIWVGKRILTDNKKSAILLMPDPAGEPINSNSILKCRRAP